ncbi:MAG: sugar ABC transporter substrate-binding protein [Propionibacteriaceae bacterium]|nr:sugar ABC transporter substrate-binding protein [Propionibacteriaceae bacterium]
MMKSIPKAAAVVMAAALALSGCTPAAQPSATSTEPAAADPGQKIVIGFAQQSLNAPYFVAMQKEAEKQAAEQGFELIFQNANNDPVLQIDQSETMVAQGVQALLVNTVTVGTEEAKMKEIAAEIPLIFIDTDIPNVGVAAVKSDNVTIGKGAGLIMAERFEKGTTIKLAILNGGPRDEITGPQRRQGFLDGLEAGGVKYEIVAEADANYSQEPAVTGTETMLAAHPDIDVIYGYNDSMALGALQALRTLGNDKVLIAGIDGQKEALAEIQKGGCTGQYVSTGLNSPSKATAGGIEIALALIKGEKQPSDIEPVTYTEAVGIGCNNIDQYYDPDSVF